MQKWEYLFVFCGQNGNEWFVRFVNETELPKWKDKPGRKTPWQFATELGEQGWELVNVITAVGRNFSDDTYRMFFKRPKP